MFLGKRKAAYEALHPENVHGANQHTRTGQLGHGETIVATLPKNPEMSDAEWEQHFRYLLQDAFCLTVSIRGERDQQLYGEDAQVFTSDSLPNPIKSIYFNNITAWRRNANNTDPQIRIQVLLDFSKPALFDPSSLDSKCQSWSRLPCAD